MLGGPIISAICLKQTMRTNVKFCIIFTDHVGKEVKIVASTKNTTTLVRTPALLECLVQGYTGKVEWRKGDDSECSYLNIYYCIMKKKSNLLYVIVTHLSE